MLLFCDIASSQIIVALDPATEVGPIKMMNAANNGPYKDNLEAYKALRVPYARTHDTPHRWNSHTVDINQLFPNWDADVNSPESYDFTLTDSLLVDMMNAGTKPFFRLGQSIEHAAKKYGIYPPKDFKKWAQICEHVIRHYNEGWADGHQWNIEYWEIWNEPDLDAPDERWKTDPRCWGGPLELFHEFYEVAAKHLKGCFPHLKIGGPAFANPRKYGPPFLDHVKATGTPLDFFSWHTYDTVENNIHYAHYAREMLDKYGFKSTETTCNEWLPSVPMRGTYHQAAEIAAVMLAYQNLPVDSAMIYDARCGVSNYSPLFNPETKKPYPAYYSLAAFGRLYKLGNQVELTCDDEDVYAVAATDGKRGCLMISNHKEEAKPLSITANGDEFITLITADGRVDSATPLPKELPANSVLSVMYTLR